MIKDIITPIADLIGRFIPDPNKKAELLAELQKHPHIERLAQMDVNKAEAAHPSLFVAGWRPFVGWVCGVGLAYVVILDPILRTVLTASGVDISALPRIQVEIIAPVLGGMLGISIPVRSWEKVNGVSRSNMTENTPNPLPQSKPEDLI